MFIFSECDLQNNIVSFGGKPDLSIDMWNANLITLCYYIRLDLPVHIFF